MDPEGERIAIKARFRDQKEYRKNEGKVLSFTLADAGRTVMAYVVTSDSPAKKEGKEVIFQVCSDRCGDELAVAMNKENESVEMIRPPITASPPSTQRAPNKKAD